MRFMRTMRRCVLLFTLTTLLLAMAFFFFTLQTFMHFSHSVQCASVTPVRTSKPHTKQNNNVQTGKTGASISFQQCN